MIYHMAHASDWQTAHEDQSAYRGSADDLRDGFIHFSTVEQIRVSAAKHRAGQRDLLLIPSTLPNWVMRSCGKKAVMAPCSRICIAIWIQHR